jgi:hypothetical protein
MRNRRSVTGSLLLDRLGVLAIILILIFGTLLSASGTLNNNGATPTDTPGILTASPAVPTVVFPTVPAGGTVVMPSGTYLHPSGLFSIPRLLGWDAAANAEQTSPPNGVSQATEVGNTFINGTLLSVVHAYVNTDPTRKIGTGQDLDKYWDSKQLDSAWSNFKGGYKELNRTLTSDNISKINFELYLDGKTYLARQVARMQDDWMMVLRLVVPNNNPDLLDKLENAIVPKYHLWKAEASSPANWKSISDPDSGYFIKLAANWSVTDGAPGKLYSANGPSGPYTFTLQTHVESGSVRSPDEVTAWLNKNIPSASVLTVKAESRSDLSGYSASYNNPDADGNKRSGVATLLNANGQIYVINFQSTARELNLLDDATAKTVPELDTIRGTFLHIPSELLVPTLTPQPTLTPLPVTASAPAPTTALPASAVPTTAAPATAIPSTAAPTQQVSAPTVGTAAPTQSTF